MIQGSIQKYSPRWVADRIRQAEEKIFSLLVPRFERARWIHFFNMALFVGFAALAFSFHKVSVEMDLNMNANSLLLISRYSALVSLILLLTSIGSLTFYFKRENLGTLDNLAFIIGFASLYFYKNLFFKNGPLGPSLNLFIEFLIFLVFYALRRRFKSPYLKWDFIMAAYLALAFSSWSESFFTLDGPLFFDTPRLLFIFSFLAAEYEVSRKFNVAQDFSYVFSTMNLITPVPVEIRNRERTDQWNVRLRGLRDIVIGFGCLLLAYQAKIDFVEFPLHLSFTNILIYGFYNYIYYFLGSYAWITIPVGLGRWFGMKLPDAFDLPLLACSPSDRWRRWNTYYYNWFYKILFFPVFKKSRSLLLAVFMVFIGTLVMHVGRFNYGLFLGDTPSLRNRTFLLVLTFFAVHSSLIYLGIKFPRMWASERKRLGWIGILWMTFLMSLVHVIAPR